MFSLRNKVIIVNTLIVIVASAFILVSLQNILYKQLLKELQKRGIFMARHLADMSEAGLLAESPEDIQLKIDNYKKTDPDIAYIYILDGQGKPLVHTFKGDFPDNLKSSPLSDGKGAYRIERVETEFGPAYDISFPVKEGKLGEVHVGLKESVISETSRTITRTVLEIALIVFLVSGLFSVYLLTRLIKPLKAVEEAGREIARGNLQYRVDVRRRDEIGVLAETFNNMAQSIEEMHRELAESHRELEAEVEERKVIQAELDRSVRFLNNVYDSIIDPFMILDRDFRIVKVNNAYAALKNRTVAELINKTCYRVLEGRDRTCGGCVIEKTIKTGDPSVKVKKTTLRDGKEIWLELYTYPIYDENSQITHVIEYTRDITDKKRAEEQRKRMIEELERISRTDSLTGLFNRRALLELLEYNLKRSHRYKTPLSVVLSDIDRFKSINDQYGHPTGDEIIKKVGRLIKDTLRASDLMGRYGGDEFLLILSDTALEGAMELSERIRRVVEKTDFVINEDLVLRITISLGVIDCSDMTDVDEIIRLVDNALYASKKAGRNRSYTISVS